MKKRLKVLLPLVLLCMLLLPITPVLADVIPLPPSNPFFNEHAEECTYLDERFTVKSPDGPLEAYEAPNGAQVLDSWNDGDSILVHYIYTDGNKTWGMVTVSNEPIAEPNSDGMVYVGDGWGGWIDTDYLDPPLGGEAPAEGSSPILWIIIGLVAALAVVTFILIRVLGKKKN